MTDKASPAGWVVQVTIPPSIAPPSPESERWIGPPATAAPSFQYFNVATGDPDKAVEAARKHLARGKTVPEDGDMRTVRALSSAEIGVLRLKSGEVKPA